MRKTACAFLVLLAVPAGADSLWNNGARPPALVAERKARQAGDLLTVVVDESASASHQATTQSSKKQTGTVQPSTGIIKFLPQLGFGNTYSQSGQGATSRSSNLSARMTVQVMRVLPDGSLEIEGKRSVAVNQETQDLKLCGRVRAEDIGADNTILSSLIADAKIVYNGNGPVNRGQKPGLLTSLLHIFF